MGKQRLQELIELDRIVSRSSQGVEVRCLGEVGHGEASLPLYAILLGNPSPEAPAVGYFGGVHGLERIGAQAVLSYLNSLLTRLAWDGALIKLLESLRLVFMPIVNPVGMCLRTRGNANGVDLMRNAPLSATGRVPFLAGGQSISRRLPWYRGDPDSGMEIESVAVCRVVEEELLTHDFSIALDCHSGYGMLDRIWFPYAHSREPMPHLPDIFALVNLFTNAHPYHCYRFEPQSRQYMTHGDLWDYLYLRFCDGRTFLPLTLEMGSWRWVKKSPWQLFTLSGIFNPLPEHRLKRVLRHHTAWFDFLGRAAASYKAWLPHETERVHCRERALSMWYGAS